MTAPRPLRPLTGDEGSSLVELLVGIALMGVFGALFSGAVFMMTNASRTAASVATTSTQLNTAFVRLDKTLRYASAISQPDRANGSWYVEFLTVNTGAQVCTQLRVDSSSQQLQLRTWSISDAGVAAAATAWAPLALGIVNGDVVTPSTDRPAPFVLPRIKGSARYPSLTVSLVGASGDASTTSVSTVTYPAVNARGATVTVVCDGHRP